MKIQNLIQFAILAIVVSIAFNTTTLGQNVPPAGNGNGNGNGNSTVVHDATLKGNGTTTSPLGVAPSGVGTTHLADGAVNAQKLAVGRPQAGQVLGSDGTNLTWQTPNSSLRIVDSLGKEVGLYDFSSGRVIFKLPATGNLVSAYVSPKGFGNSGAFLENAPRHYTSPNCTGTFYVQGGGAFSFSEYAFINTVMVSDGLIYYATEPPKPVTILSQYTPFFNRCDNTNYSKDLAPYATMPLSDLGLTPPFNIVR